MQTWLRRLMDGTISSLLGPVLGLCSTTAQRAFFSTSLGLRKARVQPFLVLHTSKLGIDQSSRPSSGTATRHRQCAISLELTS